MHLGTHRLQVDSGQKIQLPNIGHALQGLQAKVPGLFPLLGQTAPRRLRLPLGAVLKTDIDSKRAGGRGVDGARHGNYVLGEWLMVNPEERHHRKERMT